MIKKLSAVSLYLVLSASEVAVSAEISGMIFAETPATVIVDFPHLNNVPYQKKTWRGVLNFPVLGRKQSVIQYFEFSLPPEKIIRGTRELGITGITPLNNGKLEIVIFTQAKPSQYTLANEAVNALLPQWLMDAGINMYLLYDQDRGGQQKFAWDGKSWSFNQLSEALSDIVGAQVAKGGYMSVDAAREVCGNTTRPSANPDEDSYLLTRYMVQKSGCNLTKMYGYSGEALKAFMKTAPKIR